MKHIMFCQLRVKGLLSERWTDWFNDLEVISLSSGETILSGELPDQAAFFGILNQIQSIGLTLLSVDFRVEEYNETRYSYRNTSVDESPL